MMNIKLYRLASAESNVDRSWDSLIFSDESTFSSANDGPVLVDRPWGERYNSQYMSTCTCCGHLSVHCWGWITYGPGMLHRFMWYRKSPGQPSIQAYFAQCNCALCTNALSRWYNPFPARPLLHS
jgi:hypothetical protein